MWEVAVWILVLGGLFVLRAVLATLLFYFILPQGDRCPNCDAVTLRVVSRGWNVLFPWLRTSWCYECGWDGLLRHGPMSPAPKSGVLTKQKS
jgi:hypothetical protein